MSSVTLKNVSKTYGTSVVALQNASLEINDKEFLVLVGPSGCGKTTLLRLISGLEEATAGDIFIDSRRINDVAPKDRDIAMVFQNYALYPHMNVYENISFGLKFRKVPKPEIKRRVEEVSHLLELENFLSRKPRELSGGQRQRVAMGRAIVREPKVFLMDEPLSNLDAQLRIQMRVELQKLHRRLGVTTIYVTHDQTEAMTLGSRIAVMKDGAIQQVDTPIKIYEQPANLFVAGFMGSPPMNFLDVQVSSNGDGIALKAANLEIKVPKEKQSNLANDKGREIVFGIRPEAITLSGSQSTLKAVVEAVEILGAEAFLHVSLGGKRWIIKTDPHFQAATGASIDIALHLDQMHAFDKENGKTIVSSAS